MASSRNTVRRTRTAAMIGGTAAALVMGSLAPAAASTSYREKPPAPNAARDHAMGASIRAHESGATAAQPHTDGLHTGFLKVTQTPGLDVSHYQGAINWGTVASHGAKFVYIKATEGTGYRDPQFTANYSGSYNAGLIRGAYHYGRPDVSSGAAQADYFVSHGGGWSADGKTLPGALDIEYGAAGQGGTCYAKSQRGMASWIKSFSDEYHARTSRWPVIYTSASWWSQCVGTTGDFSSTSPLWVARYSSNVGALPYNWGFHTIWQYADAGTFPGDQDRFNGAYSQLQAIARG
ncbi:MAG: lysozyme [Sciscionella sp.]